MAKQLIHEGTKSLWNGRFKALCGLIVEGKDAQRAWFSSVTCPGCLAAKKK